LSVGALALALLAVVIEHWRVISRRKSDLRQTIGTAIELVDELALIHRLARADWERTGAPKPVRGFGGEAKRAAELFRLFAGTSPMTGKLALALLRCANRCEAMMSVGVETSAIATRMDKAMRMLETCKLELGMELRNNRQARAKLAVDDEHHTPPPAG